MIALHSDWSIHVVEERIIDQWMDKLLELDKCVPAERWEESHFRHPLAEKWELSRVAVVDGHLVGYMIASRKRVSLHVHRIAVESNLRGHGIGRALLCELASDADTRGVPAITLKVSRQNVSSIRFYERIGFRTVSIDDDNLAMEVDAFRLLGDR